MTEPLFQRLALSDRELVAIVGAGGKSTILLTLADELAQHGRTVVVTTTTRMASHQVRQPSLWTEDPSAVGAALSAGSELFVASAETDGKVLGIRPEIVDRIFSTTAVDQVIVEADGARSMHIKAPAGHEPVIPSLSTTVVVVASVRAIGRPIADIAHRSTHLGALIGKPPDAPLTVEDAAGVLLHPNGGLKGVPATARVAMVITQASLETIPTADSLTALLRVHPRVDLAISSLASLGGSR
jgi:molybdenum cofactor cytidylyltransferase